MKTLLTKLSQLQEHKRTHWLSQIAYSIRTCKEASTQLADVIGASGGHLDNSVQRVVRDIAIASNHVVFSKDSQYNAVGRTLFDQ